MDDLAVDPEKLARLLGLPLPFGEDDLFVIEEAISSAMGVVEGYLRRPITVRQFVERGVIESGHGPAELRYDVKWRPVVEIISVNPEPPAVRFDYLRYTVTYRAGLDVPGDRQYAPIANYIRHHVFADPTVQALYRRRVPVEETRRVKSVSTSSAGQSVSWEERTLQSETKPDKAGTAGAAPTLESLIRWQQVDLTTTHMASPNPWPYESGRYYDGFRSEFGSW